MAGKIIVIGGGFAGLAAACTLAYEGHEVKLIEKNSSTGGRARAFRSHGFMFDMGPSWYWMPEVFEQFFSRFGKDLNQYYTLQRLDPSYRIFYDDHNPFDVPASLDELKLKFESIESGSAAKLDEFLAEAERKYHAGMHQFVWKPSMSILEYADITLLRESMRLQLFASMSSHVRKFFRHPHIIRMLEFPVLFLGAHPSRTPALYSMMNYADLVLGTWYPKGGMIKISEAMTSLAVELGVEIQCETPVERIVIIDNKAAGVMAAGKYHPCDAVIAAADYHHVENSLLEENDRSYDETYWNSRTLSPSCLLFYIGVNCRVDALLHHNLFFDYDFEPHAKTIYNNPGWPAEPLFYVCCPSRTDPTVAPPGHENLFILIPAAPGLKSDPAFRSAYLESCLQRILQKTGVDLKDKIVFERSYAHEEFTEDYNAFRGNAYGLANTLQQTAFLKPRMKSKKIRNLFYAGQFTVPGPGVPPSLISGQVAAREVSKQLMKKQVTSTISQHE